MQKRSGLVGILLLVFLSINAQVPTLKITGGQDSCVSLKTLKIDIKVAGTIASTSMEMTFQNCSNRILEGTITFPLPEGVTVSGYALDINGKMREAVPVEKEKATQVFESIERRKVDPGLLEKVEGNNFRTRIYPLPAGGSRTIRISYNEVLQPGANNTLRYVLPLVYTQSIANFHLAIDVLQSAFSPLLEEQPGELAFKEWKKNYSASMDKKDYIPLGVLRFSIPMSTEKADAVMQKVNANYYFMTSVVMDPSSSRKRVLPKSIGIIWDVSISGLKRNNKDEYELLDKYFQENKNCIVYLGLLSNSFESKGSYPVLNGNWEKLKKDLEALVYDGATDFSTINLGLLPADEYLLFSDGMSTFGISSFPRNNKKIYTINSSSQADYSALQLIAKNSGGSFVNLLAKTPAESLKGLVEEPYNFIGIKNAGGISETYPSAFTPADKGFFVLTGLSSLPTGSITLQFGYGSTVSLEKTIRLNYSQQQTNLVDLDRFWAEQKITELDLQYEKNKNDIGYLGRQYSIVTRNTSLMVLETMEDYIRYKIEPPAEMRKEYYVLLKQQREEQDEEVTASLDLHNSFKALFSWWQPVVKKPSRYKLVADSTVVVNRDGVVSNIISPSPVVEDAKTMEVVVSANGQQMQRREMSYSVTTVKAEDIRSNLSGKISGLDVTATEGSLNEVVVVGYSTRKSNVATITVSDWTPERSYLAAMDKEESANFYSKYIELRKGYLSTPTFYFDMAGYFFRKQDKKTAIRILSNIAELNIEDHELYVMLGFRLKEAGDFKNALHVFKKVLDWRPHEPQSYRLYGLALADVGKWQEAADILYTGLTRKYPEETIEYYEGTQDAMLMEFNNILHNPMSKVNKARYNKKLIANMPVDIRVVLNWNRNDTDIDLWVTDPKGEKCYYGNTSTSSGALISNDMTDGYGPEQLMVRKALKGKYKIEINYFGDDQVKLTGPSTIMVEIFTRYSTGKQERKIITMQMEKEEEKEGVFVGEFNFQ